MELGISSFADMSPDPITGRKVTAEERITQLLEEVKLAEQVGLDVFAVGEHHRPDYAASSPAVILGAMAAVTKKIRLSSSVTVLSSDDPVRVFQDFATVDALSSGRSEIMAGRGSFTESFPLFGYSLNDYDTLFSEKLDLLLKIRGQEKISWKGKHRAAIDNLGIYPRPVQNPLPVWIAIGGTPESVQRAATLNLPMMLAIIGGTPDRFAPYVKYYRDISKQLGHDASKLQVGINSHAYIADTSQQAADEFYPAYADVMTRIGGERGWQPMQRAHYEMMREPHGALLVGSPQQVIDKILYEYELFKHTRFLAQIGVGTMPHDKLLRAIELFGTVVAPAVRKAIG
ncbi:MAG: LLM class flavin-dependent oxidoreductase [Cyclobacteriaceae bacterium]|nr:LLM class flavin-dependent oxidoreductase [Cyclobacteriaceae bacterium]